MYVYIFVYQGERATGYGVALLNVLFSKHIRSNMFYNMNSELAAEKNGPNSEARVTTTSPASASKRQRVH